MFQKNICDGAGVQVESIGTPLYPPLFWLDNIFKKSTSIWKVHKIVLRYIKNILLLIENLHKNVLLQCTESKKVLYITLQRINYVDIEHIDTNRSGERLYIRVFDSCVYSVAPIVMVIQERGTGQCILYTVYNKHFPNTEGINQREGVTTRELEWKKLCPALIDSSELGRVGTRETEGESGNT